MATARRREAEVGKESAQATGPDHPDAIRQREAYKKARLARPNQDIYLTGIVGVTTRHPPDLHVIAAKYAKQQRPAYNSYVRDLMREGIPLTPGAEMCFLAARMMHIYGKTLDPSREAELRARMVELLKTDDWLCDAGVVFEIADDEPDAMPDTLPLIRCHVIGPELEQLAGSAVVRQVLAEDFLPNAFERDDMDPEESVIAARLAALQPTVQVLIQGSSDYAGNVLMGLASNAATGEMYSVLLERMVAGVASGELSRGSVVPFCTHEALAAQVECFFWSRSPDLDFLESRLRMLMALDGNEETTDDVLGVPRQRFWDAVMKAATLEALPQFATAPGVDSPDSLSPAAWLRLMEIAVATDARELQLRVEGDLVPFAEALQRLAGRSGFEVYAALERHRAMAGRIAEAQPVVAVEPGRRRSMGI